MSSYLRHLALLKYYKNVINSFHNNLWHSIIWASTHNECDCIGRKLSSMDNPISFIHYTKVSTIYVNIKSNIAITHISLISFLFKLYIIWINNNIIF